MLTLASASPTDIPTLWSLRTRALLAQCAGHYDAATLRTWSAAPAPPAYPRLLTAGGGIKALVDGELAGYAILDLSRSEIDAVFVDPAHGGRGIGKALLHAIERLATQPGPLHLHASLNAVPFYQASGYRALRQTQYAHPSGVLLDCVYMEK